MTDHVYKPKRYTLLSEVKDENGDIIEPKKVRIQVLCECGDMQERIYTYDEWNALHGVTLEGCAGTIWTDTDEIAKLNADKTALQAQLDAVNAVLK